MADFPAVPIFTAQGGTRYSMGGLIMGGVPGEPIWGRAEMFTVRERPTTVTVESRPS